MLPSRRTSRWSDEAEREAGRELEPSPRGLLRPADLSALAELCRLRAEREEREKRGGQR